MGSAKRKRIREKNSDSKSNSVGWNSKEARIHEDQDNLVLRLIDEGKESAKKAGMDVRDCQYCGDPEVKLDDGWEHIYHVQVPDPESDEEIKTEHGCAPEGYVYGIHVIAHFSKMEKDCDDGFHFHVLGSGN